jgi:hypothetical protein
VPRLGGGLRPVRGGVRPLVEALEEGEDLVLAAESGPAGHEHGDLADPRNAEQLVALVAVRRHLPRLEVEAELRQALADAVGVRAPLGLVEIHDLDLAGGAGS